MENPQSKCDRSNDENKFEHDVLPFSGWVIDYQFIGCYAPASNRSTSESIIFTASSTAASTGSLKPICMSM